MSLPSLPIIPEPYLRRGPRPYAGPIAPGDVFAWEPDLPHARELVVVTRITSRPHDEQLVWTRPMDGDREVYNEMSRFREAVVETMFKPQPAKRHIGPAPLPAFLERK